MQKIRFLERWLRKNASKNNFLFRADCFRVLFPSLSNTALRALLTRSVAANLLTRVCRGIYLFKEVLPSDGLLLFHVAALLRAHEFNYISLETALSDYGIISQIPTHWITIMSSGRSNRITCGDFGTIEFIYTTKKPADLVGQLFYDQQCGLWRASVALALNDMKSTRRNCDLVDWDLANELI